MRFFVKSFQSVLGTFTIFGANHYQQSLIQIVCLGETFTNLECIIVSYDVMSPECINIDNIVYCNIRFFFSITGVYLHS